MNLFAVLSPVWFPFVIGLLLLLRRKDRAYQHALAVAGALGQMVSACALFYSVWREGVVVVHMGNWAAPFGIVFAIDTLGAVMVCLTGIVGGMGIFYSIRQVDDARMDGSYFGLLFLLFFGINGSFMTGDLFNLFVFFEVILMTSYVLMVLGNEERQTREGFTYLTLNLLGSTLFLTAAGFLYRQVGTLNMADISTKVAGLENPTPVLIVAMVFLFVFGLKSAMFPIFNWLPAAYPAPPTPISAIFAGLLTKVGVYALYRTFSTVFVFETSFTHQTVLIPIANLTMLLGVLGAVVQYDVKRILAFHSISQVGYILLGLALNSPLALAAGIFHMVHHSIIKSSLFLIGGGMELAGGTQDLKKTNGLASTAPLLAGFFLISSLALAGIPPLSGFYSKLGLVRESVGAHPWAAAAALVTSLFTLYSMIKIWRLGFWGEPTVDRGFRPGSALLWRTAGISVGFVVLLSVSAGPMMRVAQRAADQLLHHEAYVRAVLSAIPRPHPQRPESELRP